MAYTFQVTIDSVAPHDLAEWWAEALGWEVEPATRRSSGGWSTRAGPARRTPRGTAGCWCGGRAPRSTTRSRSGRPDLLPGRARAQDRQEPLHLDVRTGDDYPGSVERLLAHGATKLYDGQQGPHSWVTLTDPEGNELCVSP